MSHLAEIVKEFPHRPGVYLMKDAKGRIIYVGKARDLQKRVRSYLGTNLSTKVRALMFHVKHIEYIITPSEKEALILECNLIKTHKPRFNVVLRDDKNYPYLRLDLREEWPRLTIVRRQLQDGATYFGPFASAKAVRETLKSMDRLFPLRKCSDFVLKHRKRPCLNYQIGRCLAPCMGYVTKEDYHRLAKQACEFLEGKTTGLLEELKKQMHEAASRLEFEKAAFYRDRIQAIQKTLEKQVMVLPDRKNRDVINYIYQPKEDVIAIMLLQIRGGYLLAKRHFVLNTATATSHEAFEEFLSQYYYRQDSIPEEIILPEPLKEEQLLCQWLSDKAGRPIVLKVAQTEAEKRLLNMALENLKYLLKDESQQALEMLQRVLRLEKLPLRIEGFDISNIQGQFSVASMVVFENGKPYKDGYRRYKISLEGHPNDYAMMQEVLTRRYAHKKNLPELILIDGGQGHLNIALKVLNELNLNIPVVGIAKGKSRKDDKLFLPGRKNPLYLPKNSLALKLLQQIRNEAHRFAITYYQKRHRQGLLTSFLDKIPGIGPKRKQLLWQHFKSLEELKQASLEQLIQIGLPQRVASSLKEALEKLP